MQGRMSLPGCPVSCDKFEEADNPCTGSILDCSLLPVLKLRFLFSKTGTITIYLIRFSVPYRKAHPVVINHLAGPS